MNNTNIEELEKRIGYSFTNKKMLITALTHSSYSFEHKQGIHEFYERIEFLGDAVLELVSSDYLFKEYPNLPEGKLTKLRASIVCEPTLAICAKEFGLSEFIRVGNGEDKNGGRNRDSIVSDVLESVIGAIYLDGGLDKAKEFIYKYILNDIDSKKLFVDSKTILQELCQSKFGHTPVYEIVKEEGPDHNKTFTCHAIINDEVYVEGLGKSKKAAEQKAAYLALMKMQDK